MTLSQEGYWSGSELSHRLIGCKDRAFMIADQGLYAQRSCLIAPAESSARSSGVRPVTDAEKVVEFVELHIME